MEEMCFQAFFSFLKIATESADLVGAGRSTDPEKVRESDFFFIPFMNWIENTFCPQEAIKREA